MFGRVARASVLSEPGALTAELPCGSVRAVPPRHGTMAARIIGMGLGDVLLQADCAQATVVLPAADAAALLGRRRSLPPALRPGAHALLRAHRAPPVCAPGRRPRERGLAEYG